MKLDAMVFVTPQHARVIDYKTGRRQGNEVKHTEQGQIYQLSTFLRFPELEEVSVEFWYTDLGETDRKHYVREQGVAYFDKYHSRLNAVTDATEFPPNPNAFSCKWCAYRGNACEYGVSGGTAASARPRQFKPRHQPA